MGQANYGSSAARSTATSRAAALDRQSAPHAARTGGRAGIPAFLQHAAGRSGERLPPETREAIALPRFLQPKLKLSQPHGGAEAEADRAADEAVRALHDTPPASGFPARDGAAEQASEGSGGQALPRRIQRFMEARFDADLGAVRLHRDAGADAAARAMNARAFTVGRDIAFASDEFQPETPTGCRLLAHEMAHVVQQSGGSPAGRRSPQLHAAERSIQRAVRTLGGEWDTTKYDVVQDAAGTTDIGVDIALNFKPEDPVDAELIGLTQTSRTIIGGKLAFPTDTTRRRAIPAGEKGVEEGTKIDRLSAYGNPLYAATSPGVADTLASTPTSAFWGQHGWHYNDPLSGAQHQDAILKDTPTVDPPGANSSQNFESAALAVKGSQDGTYYGSVTWGWQTDAAGTLSKSPLAIGSAGVPSATFMRAAELWNTNTTSSGTATINLPTSSLPANTTLPSSRSTSDLVIAIARVNSELASMLPGTDKTNKEFEKKALAFELAKRADQPTLSLADQEKAATLLATPDLIKRADALPAEIAGMAAGSARTDKELEQEAVKREIPKRRMLITVHVHETEDTFGADSVYVVAWSGFLATRTSVVDLDNGDEHAFVVPLSALFAGPPLSHAFPSLFVRAYDEDWEGDDLMFDKKWDWSGLPAEETQSRDGGKYTVRIDFAQLR